MAVFASKRCIHPICRISSTEVSWFGAIRKWTGAITLSGRVGNKQKEIVNESTFPEKTTEGKAFIEQIWARRKVGYLLDQIRQHGESKELVDETKLLAKRYGIATPYTSYLIVPDSPMPMTGPQFRGGRGGMGPGVFGGGGIGGGMGMGMPGMGSAGGLPGAPKSSDTVTDLARQAQPTKGAGSAAIGNDTNFKKDAFSVTAQTGDRQAAKQAKKSRLRRCQGGWPRAAARTGSGR